MGPNSLQHDVLHYVYSYGAVVLLVILYLLWRPSKTKPSRLKLRESDSQNKLEVQSKNSSDRPRDDYKNAPENSNRIERQLNVIFQYNGHDFDAHEVFGVPAGCSLQIVQAAYEEVLIKTDSESRKFYEVAYRAILLKSKPK
jgi:hypothetical protein